MASRSPIPTDGPLRPFPRGAGLRRTAGAGLLAAALTLTPGALALPAATASEKAEDTTLKLALTGDIDSLNPFTAILAASTNILLLQYEGLVTYGPENNEIVPALAESWETSEDGTTWTYTIGEDRKWSDGEPVTAQDAEFTFNAIAEDDTLKAANGTLLENIDSVEATDDQTLVITLNEAQAPNPGADLAIVPEHIWSKVEDPSTFENSENAVGSGPFTVESYSPSSGVRMKANPNYWRGKAKVDAVTYVPYRNSDAAVQALLNGELDVVGDLTPAQYKALESEENITVNSGAGRRYQALNINSGTINSEGKLMGDGNPALQDIELRKAIARAIDSKTLLEKVLEGLGEQATGEIPAVYPLYHWDTDEELPYSYDPEEANRILDEAGYKMGPDGIRLDKEGKPLKLRLAGSNSKPTHAQMADYVVPWLKEIGIEATTEIKASGQLNDDSILGNYDMYFTGWGIGPDPDFQLSINQCSSRPNADGTGATNESNWCSPEFDALYKEQHTELDQERRSELVVEAQKLIYDAAVNHVLFYADSLEAYRSDKFEPFTTQPKEGGVILAQNGPWGVYSATPAGELEAAGATSEANPEAVIIPVVGVLVVGGLAAFFLAKRRRATADDRQ
ncbi:ABC transporter substrate-binding protein [Arthrobacter crusticola]|uniref:ABC transporter substrate-binding protein n=1 Tax=Arthrobacter crusticola TaxID=2547960 RepID=A0A4R5TZC5_9MICC|nr:ABC transporter substrate-binding protein [Arthrobacter crusticola]TDK26639.1 ABC transporter substrate-binding protein [Arthrobacter crusticola]